MLRQLLLVAFVTFAVSPVQADEKPYLTHDQLNIAPFLPKPIANGSDDDRAQQAIVIAAQKSVSEERLALARSDSEETVYAMFGRVMGDKFIPANLPLSTVFFARIGETEDALVDPVKGHFGRIRPFLNNSDIKPLVKPSTSNSYPSGHTSRSKMMGIVLGMMVPERRDAIFARAEDYAYSRIVGGMHYPDDLVAGRLAGTAIAAYMLADPAFQKDMKVAQEELRKVLGL
jgi:acid phosphatase (class A)